MRFFIIVLLIAFVVFGIYLDVEAQDTGYSDYSEGSDNSGLLLAGALGLAGMAGATALYMHKKGKKKSQEIEEHQNYMHGELGHDEYANHGYRHAEYSPHPEREVNGHRGYIPHPEHDVYEHPGYGAHPEHDVYGYHEYGAHPERATYEHRGYSLRSEHGGYVPNSENARIIAHPSHR